MNVILSIKPRFAIQILDGNKKVEFRKAAFKQDVQRVYIYSSAPTMKIVGYFTIKEVVNASPEELWKLFNHVGGIEKEDFFNYFKSSQEGVSLCIDKVVRFNQGIDPTEVIPGFVPPQSYRYLAQEIEAGTKSIVVA